MWEPYPAKTLADEFYSKSIHAMLVKALAALAKEKPSGEPIAVCVSLNQNIQLSWQPFIDISLGNNN